jgi:D-glycero-alpha-D-manno-heptose 1-phosphate guanylyltransferase
MDAIILCGGLGTRIKNELPHLPKALAPVNNFPFLLYLFQQLQKHNLIDRIILSIGYKGEKIKQWVSSSSFSKRIIFSLEKEQLGTGGALKRAMNIVRSENVLVMNGDSYLDCDIDLLWKQHLEKKALITIACLQKQLSNRYGCIKFCEENKQIFSFVEKDDKPTKGYINGGVYIFNKILSAKFPKKSKFSLEKEVFPLFLENKLYAFPCYGKFIDIGTPASLKEAQLFFGKLT